jgi:hypothetical protein
MYFWLSQLFFILKSRNIAMILALCFDFGKIYMYWMQMVLSANLLHNTLETLKRIAQSL